MKNSFKLILVLSIISITQVTYASMPVIDVGAIGKLTEEINRLKDIKDLNMQSLQQLQQEVTALTGHYGMGALAFDPKLQSWGEGAETWESALNLYNQVGSSNGLGGVAHSLQNQFPILPNSVVSPNSNSINAHYYDLQAKTTLAARSASQLDFDKVQQQIAYMQKLQSQIDKSSNLKEAVDLQNRLQVENSLIQLELLRQTALSNQQQALKSQGEINTVVNNYNAAQ